MSNQIQPSHAQEEQPERFYCRHCGNIIWKFYGKWTKGDHSSCTHEPERRMDKNAQKRRDLQDKIEEVRSGDMG